MSRRAWRLATAVRCALLAPRVIARDMPALLALAPPSSTHVDDAPARTLHATRRALALLGRLPGGHWRLTCLYVSVAECLALRAGGRVARVVLGVARSTGRGHGAEIAAHAWVECPAAGIAPNARDTGHFVPLRAPAG